MIPVIEDTAGKIRDLPITPRLKRILAFAGSIAGIDEVRVTSGGQCARGTCSKRTGSTRHDLGNAADLDLVKDNRVLKFTVASELPFFEAFVEAAASFGATGIGGDKLYMGPTRVHVGFGRRATWGGNGGRGAAPRWLSQAAEKGWNNPLSLAGSVPNDASRFLVNARSGLRLRSGPSLDFSIIKVLPTGTIVTVQDLSGENEDWAKVDLEGDGVIDGYVFRSFLEPIQQNVSLGPFTVLSNIEEDGDNCAPDNLQDDDDKQD